MTDTFHDLDSQPSADQQLPRGGAFSLAAELDQSPAAHAAETVERSNVDNETAAFAALVADAGPGPVTRQSETNTQPSHAFETQGAALDKKRGGPTKLQAVAGAAGVAVVAVLATLAVTRGGGNNETEGETNPLFEGAPPAATAAPAPGFEANLAAPDQTETLLPSSPITPTAPGENRFDTDTIQIVTASERTQMAVQLYADYGGVNPDTLQMATDAPLEFYLGDANRIIDVARSSGDARVLWPLFKSPNTSEYFAAIASAMEVGNDGPLSSFEQTINGAIDIEHTDDPGAQSRLILEEFNGGTTSIPLEYQDGFLQVVDTE